MQTKQFRRFHFAASLIVALSSTPLLAQQAPDAGRVLENMKQEPIMEQLLPLHGDTLGSASGRWDYLYEPDAKQVIDDLMIRYIESLIYQAVADNLASEQSSRMVAMKAATDNAGNVIEELKLIYNKTRQAAITKELSEIVAGAAAV